MDKSFGFWAVIVGYLLITTAIGAYIGYRNRVSSIKEFFNSGKGLPPVAVACTIVATCMSGGMWIGTPGTLFNASYAGYAWVCFLGGALGVLLSNLLLGAPMRKISETHNTITITDLLVDMYKSPKLRLILIPTILLSSFGMLVAQWVSIGNLVYPLTGIPYWACVIVGVVVVFVYMIVGGNNSNSYISIFQLFLAMFAALFLFIMGLRVCGGFFNLHINLANVDTSLVSMNSAKWSGWTSLSYFLLYSIGQCGQPQVTTKFFSIKSHKLLPTCLFVAVLTHTVVNLVPAVGIFMRHQVETGAISALERADLVMPTFISTYCPEIIGGLLVAGILAAVMSTAASLLLVSSSAFVKDFMGDMLHVNIEGKRGVTISRIVILAVVVITALFALTPPESLLNLASEAWGIVSAVTVPALIGGLRWRRSTKAGAWASVLTGFIIVVGTAILNMTGIWAWPLPILRGAFGMIASTVVYIIVCLATPKEDKSHYMPPTLAELKAAQAAKN